MSSKILQWIGLIYVTATAPLVFTFISNSIKSAEYLASAVQKREKENYQGALADFNRMIAIEPSNGEAHRLRGNLKYQKLNDAQGALADFNRAIEYNPIDADAYRLRGNLKKLVLNDLLGGINDLKQAAKLFQQQNRYAKTTATIW